MISRANLSNFSSVDRDSVSKILPPLISLILVVVIGWQLARIIWLLMPGSAVGDAVPAPATPVQAASQNSVSADAQAISESHIFGQADVEQAAPPPTEEFSDLEDTRMVLTLNGTVASEIPRYSIAIISDGGKDQEVYAVGDSISNNTTLHAVYPDRVVLNENGKLTNLKLPREFKDEPASNLRRTTTTTRPVVDDTQSIQAVVTQNLTKLTDVIRPTPYRVGGEQVGFRVYPGRDRRQFAALGLRPGDIIKDIDGQALSDASQAMQIFQSLGTAEQVTVTIEREGQSETLTLKTSQLDLSDEQTK